MSFSRKKTRQYAYILLLPAILLVLSFTLITPVYYQNLKDISGKSLSCNTPKEQPLVNKELTFIMTFFTENEIMMNVANHHIINRGVQDGRQLVTVITCVLAVLLCGYAVMLQYMKCYVRKTGNQVPLLALSRGGHAPPLSKAI